MRGVFREDSDSGFWETAGKDKQISTVVILCIRWLKTLKTRMDIGFWRPQQESNLYFSLRRTTLYPFNYGAGASNFKAFLIYELERLPNRAKFLWFVSGDFSFNRPRFWSAALSGCLNRLKGSFCTAKPFLREGNRYFGGCLSLSAVGTGDALLNFRWHSFFDFRLMSDETDSLLRSRTRQWKYELTPAGLLIK